MRACAAALVAAGLAGLTLAGCELDRGAGYVELKTLALGAGPILVLDSARLDPLRKGQAILRAKVGSHMLQVEGPGGMLVSLCELVVKPDLRKLNSRPRRAAGCATALRGNAKPQKIKANSWFSNLEIKYSIISLMRIGDLSLPRRGLPSTNPTPGTAMVARRQQARHLWG